MVYADYAYYTDTYHGDKLTEAEFLKYSRQASAMVDRVTFGRLMALGAEDIIGAVKDATCAAAERIKTLETRSDTGIASESNDGYSVAYKDVGKADSRDYEVMAVIATYLEVTGLLYRGVYRNHDLCDS